MIELLIIQNEAPLLFVLEELLIGPVSFVHGVLRENEVDRQRGMPGSAQQLLVTRVLELRCFFYPDDGHSVDGLQLGGFVHALEDYLRAILKAYLHGGLDEPHHRLTVILIGQMKVLSQFLKQGEAGLPDGLIDLTNDQNLPLLLDTLQNDLEGYVVGLGRTISSHKKVELGPPVTDEVSEVFIDLFLKYHITHPQSRSSEVHLPHQNSGPSR